MCTYKVMATICEYNPFHYGHKYNIECSKKALNADAVICVMSGSFVQRGEAAIFDKWQRAETAVENGADLVIELPAYYVLQSAQSFAFGGVKLINELNIADYITFGSECGSIEQLNKISEILLNEPPLFKDTLKKHLETGNSYPYALDKAINSCMQNSCALMPNDILAANYITALKKLNSNIKPYTIKRTNQYHSTAANNKFASATAIRKMIENGIDTTQFSPDANGCTYTLDNIFPLIAGYLRLTSAKQIKSSNIIGMENGLENRLTNAAKISNTPNEFYSNLCSKRYTMHRVKRAAICTLLQITHGCTLDYVRPLAFNKTGAKLLGTIKEKSKLNIVSKMADFNFGSDSMIKYDILSTDIAALCANDASERYAGKDYKKSPVFVK